MSPRRLWTSLVFVFVLVSLCIAGFAVGIRPLLGLDLRGGVQVVLHAPDGTSPDVMEQALENIRNRVDAAGVGEPDISVTGSDILVQIPGLARGTIDERAKTQFCLIGQGDASLRCFASQADADAEASALAVDARVTEACLKSGGESWGCFPSKAEAETALKGITLTSGKDQFCLSGTGAATDPCFKTKKEAGAAKDAASIETTEEFCMTGTKDTSYGCSQTQSAADAALAAVKVEKQTRQFCVLSAAGKNLGCSATREDAEALLQATGQDRLIQLIGTTARLEQREVREEIAQTDPATGQPNPAFASTKVTCGTPAEKLLPDCSFEALKGKEVVFASTDGKVKYRMGPVEITGDAIKKAAATLQTPSQTNPTARWVVSFDMTPDGSKTFGEVTGRLIGKQLAIILDERVISAPTVNGKITGSGEITGNFTEQRAKDLATVLNAGALPVNLTKSNVVTVSATLGKESLKEGLIAGLAGLIVLALYLLFYYRLLGVVTWLGMAIWAILALGMLSLLGRTVGYSLTLPGVAGIIVSLGITTDSYIVFYERLKDEIRRGKTPRASVQPAFKRAWHTILAADVVTILAAAVLYVVAIASVRGFALTLGLATTLDLFVVWFYKRPTVFLLARSPRTAGILGMGLWTPEGGLKHDMETEAEEEAEVAPA